MPNGVLQLRAGRALLIGALVCLLVSGGTASSAPRAQLADVQLTIVLSGRGSVSVSAGGTAQTCAIQDELTEPICDFSYPQGTSVTLAATAASGRSAAGWSLAECPGIGPCTITLDTPLSVVAKFTPYRLVVLTEGAGTVQRSAPGSGCGSENPCTALYEPGAEVTLTAAPETAGEPIEWDQDSWCELEGGDFAQPTCRATIDFDPTYVAVGFGDEFPPVIPFTVDVKVKVGLEGSGQGRVGGPGLDCPATCLTDWLPYGTKVTLVAQAQEGSRFVRWRGACATDATCVLRAGAVTSVRAVFDQATSSPPPPPPPQPPPSAPPPPSPPPPPAAPPPAAAPQPPPPAVRPQLPARLAGVSVVHTPARRAVVVRLVVGAPAEAIVRLIRGRHELLRGRYQVAAGTSTLRLTVPPRVAAGAAWLVVTARDQAGRLRQLSRRVLLPAP